MINTNVTSEFYFVNPDELAFFQDLTKIRDQQELKRHIVDVQKKAFQIYGYNCIRRFAFVKLKISHLPGYKKALNLLDTQINPILMDIGCCFGNDTRKAVVDGWPVESVIASDLRKEFWDCGHELFKSTPTDFPVKFIPGDVFSPDMLEPRGPFIEPKEVSDVLSRPVPPFSSLQSLRPLQGKLSAIHASAFFHLFPEEQQKKLAILLSSLIRPEKGSVIFGQHGAMPEKGFRQRTRVPSSGSSPMFCHSPESWKEMWLNVYGAAENLIEVDAELVQVERRDLLDEHSGPQNSKFYVMNWCITRR